MGLFDKVGAFIKREAEDIGEVAERARDRLDAELTEREEELEMTPSEKLRALQRKSRETDDRFDEIIDKAEARASQAEAETEVAAIPVDLGEDAPNVTHIVLPDGSVRSGDDPPEPAPGEDDEEVEDAPGAGELSWVAPREGEEAVVPAFQGRVATADPSGAGDGENPASPVGDTQPDQVDPISEPLVDPFPDAPAQPALATEPDAETFQTAASPDVLAPGLEDHPPPPPAPAVATESAESAPATAADLTEPHVAPASVPVDAPASVPTEPVPVSTAREPVFDKTPAQIKYEQAREAADELLNELRGELKADGEI